jgi:hypothetical protein
VTNEEVWSIVGKILTGETRRAMKIVSPSVDFPTKYNLKISLDLISVLVRAQQRNRRNKCATDIKIMKKILFETTTCSICGEYVEIKFQS